MQTIYVLLFIICVYFIGTKLLRHIFTEPTECPKCKESMFTRAWVDGSVIYMCLKCKHKWTRTKIGTHE